MSEQPEQILVTAAELPGLVRKVRRLMKVGYGLVPQSVQQVHTHSVDGWWAIMHPNVALPPNSEAEIQNRK